MWLYELASKRGNEIDRISSKTDVRNGASYKDMSVP